MTVGLVNFLSHMTSLISDWEVLGVKYKQWVIKIQCFLSSKHFYDISRLAFCLLPYPQTELNKEGHQLVFLLALFFVRTAAVVVCFSINKFFFLLLLLLRWWPKFASSAPRMVSLVFAFVYDFICFICHENNCHERP